MNLRIVKRAQQAATLVELVVGIAVLSVIGAGLLGVFKYGFFAMSMVRENQRAVHAAWRLHADDVRHSLVNGFYQGWDLHPAQLPSRYGAVAPSEPVCSANACRTVTGYHRLPP